jgi:hypothetical protein
MAATTKTRWDPAPAARGATRLCKGYLPTPKRPQRMARDVEREDCGPHYLTSGSCTHPSIAVSIRYKKRSIWPIGM